MPLDDLLAVCPPPAATEYCPTPAQWTELETQVGHRLPSDYKAFGPLRHRLTTPAARSTRPPRPTASGSRRASTRRATRRLATPARSPRRRGRPPTHAGDRRAVSRAAAGT